MTLGHQVQSFKGSADTPAQLVAVTATIEGYVDGILRRLVSSSGYEVHHFFEGMYKKLEDSIYQSWPERFHWLKVGFGVSISGSTAAQEMQVVIDLRNAVVHGGQWLTERQSRDVGDLIDLERRAFETLGVRTERRRLFFAPDTTGRAVGVCRRFVLALDDELRQQCPAVDL